MEKEETIAFLTKTFFDSNNVLRVKAGFKPLELPRDKDVEISWCEEPLIKAIRHHAEYLYQAMSPYLD